MVGAGIVVVSFIVEVLSLVVEAFTTGCPGAVAERFSDICRPEIPQHMSVSRGWRRQVVQSLAQAHVTSLQINAHVGLA